MVSVETSLVGRTGEAVPLPFKRAEEPERDVGGVENARRAD